MGFREEIKQKFSEWEAGNKKLQLLIESNNNFVPDSEDEKEFKESLNWIIKTVRKQKLTELIHKYMIEDDDSIVEEIGREIYTEMYEEPKIYPKLRLVK